MADEYQSRLAKMESWYDELVTRDDREQLLIDDYEPHRQFLRSLGGDILDVGGGAGVAARYLDPRVHYVVVDPLESWNSAEWSEFGRAFRSSGPEPEFVKARGEALPFPAESFDIALSYWSLNHVENPAECVSEIARVLKRGGSARLVIDDVQPSWWDLAWDGSARLWTRLTGSGRPAAIHKPLREAVALKIRGEWPIKEDHFPIAEADLLRWTRPALHLVNRRWVGGSIAFDFAKD